MRGSCTSEESCYIQYIHNRHKHRDVINTQFIFGCIVVDSNLCLETNQGQKIATSLTVSTAIGFDPHANSAILIPVQRNKPQKSRFDRMLKFIIHHTVCIGVS